MFSFYNIVITVSRSYNLNKKKKNVSSNKSITYRDITYAFLFDE